MVTASAPGTRIRTLRESPSVASLRKAPSPKAERRRKPNRILRLFAMDLALFIAFVVVMNIPLTGTAVHEWVGIGIAIGVIVHLLQHTNWIVTTTKRIFGSCSFRNRLSYVMMMGLFAGFFTIIVSGLVISEAALPLLGVEVIPSDFWFWLHLSSVSWVLWLTALHLALDWKWITQTVRRFAGKKRAPKRSALRSVS